MSWFGYTCRARIRSCQLASVIALVDFTAENGATRVVPGSHRWDWERMPEAHEFAMAAMPAGSAVIYLGSTLHGGGPNTTANQWRRGMHLSYVLGWLRTEENHYLATPPAIARTLPRQAQELLGYAGTTRSRTAAATSARSISVIPWICSPTERSTR